MAGSSASPSRSSSTRSRHSSLPQSPAAQSTSPTQGSRPFDGNRDPEPIELGRNFKNLDVGFGVWSSIRGSDNKTAICPRPKPSSIGREIIIGLNTFNVKQFPTASIYQYDVIVGNGAEKRGVVTKIWESKALRQALGGEKGARRWIFDKTKLAWSLEKLDKELRVNVNLDEEQGRQPRNGKPDVHRVIIRLATTVKFDTLRHHLAGKCDFDASCIEALTVADHILREWPSQRLTSIKRNFFQSGQERFPLGGNIEAFKGVYASMRMGHQAGAEHALTVNVDVANGTFWTSGSLSTTVLQLAGARTEADLVTALKPKASRISTTGSSESRGFTELKRLRRLHVTTAYRPGPDGKPMEEAFVIDKILNQTSRTYKFRTGDNGPETSVADYFQSKYSIRLRFPDWPVVRMTRKAVVLPLELLKVPGNQRYPFKLDERQTSQMIKFAVTPPQQRWKDVQNGLKMLQWDLDPYHESFGLRINTTEAKVKARLLQNPTVQFANDKTDPRTSGRWDLKGKKFLKPNSKPLQSWGVCVISGGRFKPDKTTIEHFLNEFMKVYTLHGGRIDKKDPPLHLASSPDIGKAVSEIWNKAGNAAQVRPQMLVFILPDRNTQVYGRIKKSAECRYGVVSQCMQYAHVQKCQPQYISNVCMKFNAKLGGSTARAIGPTSKGPTGIFKVPTIIVGADVSHPPPMSQADPNGPPRYSTAAITVSMDSLGIRYAAGVNTNGCREEMIQTANWDKLLKPMMQHWITTVGGGRLPQRFIYFRDGVSEGQFQQVLNHEVRDIKQLLRSANEKVKIDMIVIIASKRHHIRFFPKPGDKAAADRNDNPLPGTLVETGVTQPFENDFFLASHAAIKGTARPTHYHILLNEPGTSNEELQTMIYEHCYQYVRATTPVSLFPAVYYAHVASLHAQFHDITFGGGSNDQKKDSQAGSDKAQSTPQDPPRQTTTSSSQGDLLNVPDLLTMPNADEINTSMWYI